MVGVQLMILTACASAILYAILQAPQDRIGYASFSAVGVLLMTVLMRLLSHTGATRGNA